MNPKVDFYFNKPNKWQVEINKLRTIVLNCLPNDHSGGLSEELKWGVPCYTFRKSNLILIHVFKEYCAILFFKGALLADNNKILIQQTENVQAARQIRFTSIQQIIEMENIIKTYIYEAMEVEKAGLKVELKKPTEFKMTDEFQRKLSSEIGSALKVAFESLTPGRQRAYLLYFSAPKQSKTREDRVEKSISQILAGKGLDD